MNGPGLILVIDDSLTVRRVLELAFAGTGHVVRFAGTGEAGIQQVLQYRPDLVILDFVLPDMKGAEICRRLEQHDAVANVPILIMSGKDHGIIDELVRFTAVKDYIGKPFTKEQILTRVARILGYKKSTVSDTPLLSVPAMSDLPGAAQAIYAQLRASFAQIPAWIPLLGTRTPAPFFAKKILTRDTVGGLVAAIAPFTQAPAPVAATPSTATLSLDADLASLPLLDLLRTLSGTGRTGVLHVHHGEQHDLVCLRHGSIVLATCHDAARYHAAGAAAGRNAPPPLVASAEAAQKASATPAQVTLYEAGYLDEVTLGAALRERTSTLVGELLGLEAGRMSFDDGVALPAWAEQHGRVASLQQLQLERWRRATPWVLIDQMIPDLDVVFERAPQFSQRLGQLELEAEERRLLALVDGVSAVRDILDRGRVAQTTALPVLFRLRDAGLLRKKPRRTSAPLSSNVRAVLVYDSDGPGFRDALEAQLAQWSEPVSVIALDATSDWANAATRERPALVLLNATESLERAVATAHALCTSHDLAHTRLAAVVDVPTQPEVDELLRSGFDAVLVKPVHIADLDRLLGGVSGRMFAGANLP